MLRVTTLRCPSNYWGRAYGATGTLRVRCRGKHCRDGEGCPVIHLFDLATGEHRTMPDMVPDEPAEDMTHARYATV